MRLQVYIQICVWSYGQTGSWAAQKRNLCDPHALLLLSRTEFQFPSTVPLSLVEHHRSLAGAAENRGRWHKGANFPCFWQAPCWCCSITSAGTSGSGEGEGEWIKDPFSSFKKKEFIYYLFRSRLQCDGLQGGTRERSSVAPTIDLYVFAYYIVVEVGLGVLVRFFLQNGGHGFKLWKRSLRLPGQGFVHLTFPRSHSSGSLVDWVFLVVYSVDSTQNVIDERQQKILKLTQILIGMESQWQQVY